MRLFPLQLYQYSVKLLKNVLQQIEGSGDSEEEKYARNWINFQTDGEDSNLYNAPIAPARSVEVRKKVRSTSSAEGISLDHIQPYADF